MAIAKRIFLFVLLNLLVVVTISILMSVLGVEPYLTAQGLNVESLAVFCLIWGMGGAFISLALSRIMAKAMMGVKVIDPGVRDPELQELVQTVHQLARAAGLPAMPEVGIYRSPELNAFATGPTKSRSLVAVSTGLLQRMNREQSEGVLGQEVAHIANGDMVTMTLLQGVINAFVMFLARIVAFAIDQAMRRDDEGRGMGFFAHIILVNVLEFFFMFLGMFVIAGFSRFREYRADRGGARLAGRDKMIAALEGLRRGFNVVDPAAQAPAFNSMKISGHPSGLARLLSTHPSLESRITRLETMTSI